MSWQNVIGQQQVKAILTGALRRGRLAHAYLFSGPKGVGKDSAAIELARAVNCIRHSDEACGICKSCMQIDRLEHPDVRLVFPMPVGKNEKSGDDPLAKLSDDDVLAVQTELRLKAQDPYHRIELPRANNIKINSIRQLRAASSLGRFGSARRVFLILDADKMNEESANALLKTLEEPHDNTLLVLTTSHPDRLLPTISSRCQHVRFNRLSPDELAEALQAREGLQKEEARALAALADGSYAEAVDLKGAVVRARCEDAVGYLRNALYKSRSELMEDIQKFQSDYEREDLVDVLATLETWLRDAMVNEEGLSALMSGMDKETVDKFLVRHRGLDYATLFTAIEKAISLVNRNVYIPLVLIQLALDLRESMSSPLKPGSLHQGVAAGTATTM